jgi:hypothetical protein
MHSKDKENLDDLMIQVHEPSPGFRAEFWDFVVHNKKWWLTHIIATLTLVGVLLYLSGTAVAPLIYTLF